MKKIVLGFILLVSAVISTQGAEQHQLLNEDIPDQYEVEKGDTLWGISALFLRDPWMWPEIWHASQQVDNPQLIYPGDLISLVYIDGKPRLQVNRSREHKLSPQIRTLDHQRAVAVLPLDTIDNFLSKTRVTSGAELKAAPYVLGGYERRLLMGMGDDFYARGDFTDNQLNYGIYRRGDPYIEPSTGEVLGLRAEDVGSAKVKAVKDSIATLGATRSVGEIRFKDRLLSREERSLVSSFYPRAPKDKVAGVVLNVEGGVRNAGALDVVALNRGDRDGLQAGDTLAIYKEGDMIKDRIADERIRLPDERIGLLMVFSTYDKMSFGLVMQADRQLDIGDLVRNP